MLGNLGNGLIRGFCFDHLFIISMSVVFEVSWNRLLWNGILGGVGDFRVIFGDGSGLCSCSYWLEFVSMILDYFMVIRKFVRICVVF
jgi:hypothetical protein